jgi:hypothetical protein
MAAVVAPPAVTAPHRQRHLVVVPSDGSAVGGAPGSVSPGRVVVVPARRHSPAVYRRRRVAVLLVLGLGALGAWLGLRVLLGDNLSVFPPSGRPLAARVWVVRPGDTLWSIALACGDNGDIRPLVDQLSAEVHGEPLQVGERISVP